MTGRGARAGLLLAVAGCITTDRAADVPARPRPPVGFRRAALLSPAAATANELARLEAEGYDAAMLRVEPRFATADVRSAAVDPLVPAAADRVRAAGLGLGLWLEIARNEPLARLAPGSVASLQGHEEWRRRFPEAPAPAANEIVRCWPWVPLLGDEGRRLHEEWIAALIPQLPPADWLLLDGLQGGPSACGCGNLQCRWALDYGPKRTAQPAGDDAARRFVVFVRSQIAAVAGRDDAAPRAVIPVWTTECEKADGAADGLCAGVGCYEGRCWREMWKQLDPLAAEGGPLGLLLLTRTFERSGLDDRAGASWLGPAIRALAADDPRRAGPPIGADRLIGVIEAWGRSGEVVAAELAALDAVGVACVIVIRMELDQSFEPRLTVSGR